MPPREVLSLRTGGHARCHTSEQATRADGKNSTPRAGPSMAAVVASKASEGASLCGRTRAKPVSTHAQTVWTHARLVWRQAKLVWAAATCPGHSSTRIAVQLCQQPRRPPKQRHPDACLGAGAISGAHAHMMPGRIDAPPEALVRDHPRAHTCLSDSGPLVNARMYHEAWRRCQRQGCTPPSLPHTLKCACVHVRVHVRLSKPSSPPSLPDHVGMQHPRLSKPSSPPSLPDHVGMQHPRRHALVDLVKSDGLRGAARLSQRLQHGQPGRGGGVLAGAQDWSLGRGGAGQQQARRSGQQQGQRSGQQQGWRSRAA
eukprot:352745-Chlamydomonas_euryale.AAC.3